MGDLRELIERVEKLEGPVDGVTAAGLANSFGPWPCESEEWHLFVNALRPTMEAIGAAIALCERVLPGWDVTACFDGASAPVGKRGGAVVRNPSLEEEPSYTAWGHPTPSIALTVATLRALSDQVTRQGEESGR